MKNWEGGRNPAGRRYITVRFRDHRIKTVPAHQVDWLHDPRDSSNDVIAWEEQTLQESEKKAA